MPNVPPYGGINSLNLSGLGKFLGFGCIGLFALVIIVYISDRNGFDEDSFAGNWHGTYKCDKTGDAEKSIALKIVNAGDLSPSPGSRTVSGQAALNGGGSIQLAGTSGYGWVNVTSTNRPDDFALAATGTFTVGSNDVRSWWAYFTFKGQHCMLNVSQTLADSKAT